MAKDRVWITRAEACVKIGEAGGEFFTAVVRKKGNGQFRKFNCRLGVKKGVNGKGMAYDPKAYDLITIWDGYKKGFRMLSVPHLIMLKVNGQKYYVKD